MNDETISNPTRDVRKFIFELAGKQFTSKDMKHLVNASSVLAKLERRKEIKILNPNFHNEQKIFVATDKLVHFDDTKFLNRKVVEEVADNLLGWRAVFPQYFKFEPKFKHDKHAA